MVVVDFVPSPAARLPPAFAQQRAAAAAAGKKGGAGEVAHLAHVWHPLRESWDWLGAGAERELECWPPGLLLTLLCQPYGMWHALLAAACFLASYAPSLTRTRPCSHASLLLPAGRRQALAERALLDAEAAAEAERVRERQQDTLQLMLKKAARAGATAGGPGGTS